MKKLLSLLVLLGLLGTSSVQAWGKPKPPTQLIFHNLTGEDLTVFGKYSGWIKLGKAAKATLKAAAITAGNILIAGAASTGNVDFISYKGIGYPTGNGLVVYLGKGKLNKKTNKREETTYTSNKNNGIVKIYIKGGFTKNLNSSDAINKFRETKNSQLIDDFKTKGKKKLQNKVHVKDHKTTHIYIGKNKRKDYKKKGRYKVWVTQPEKDSAK